MEDWHESWKSLCAFFSQDRESLNYVPPSMDRGEFHSIPCVLNHLFKTES